MELGFQFAELGLPNDGEYLVYDFWEGRLRGSFRERFSASVATRSNLLLAVHRAAGRPQFLSTDRHLTQGGVSLEDLSWDDASKVLSGSVRLVEGFPSELVFFVPSGYQLASVKADGAKVVETKTNPDGTVTVTLRRATSGSARWRLAF